MSTIKDKVVDAGQAALEKAKNVGHKIAAGAEQAGDWVKEKTGLDSSHPTVGPTANIRDKMEVIASCGTKIGVVDHLEDGAIKLTRKDSPDNTHHYIPISWIDHVDSHVHLSKNAPETRNNWKNDAQSCGC